MWDKESRRAARQAYKANRRAAREAYRAARYQYRTARRPYRVNNRGYGVLGLVLLLIIIFSSSHMSHGMGFFTLILPAAIIGVFIWLIARNRMYQNPYPPFGQPTQQSDQSAQQPYYQAPQPPPAPPEAYQDYHQGYQAPISPEVESQQEYRASSASQEAYDQDEQPQALYPQSLPPMEQ
jgi:hypothetical protein